MKMHDGELSWNYFFNNNNKKILLFEYKQESGIRFVSFGFYYFCYVVSVMMMMISQM